MASYLRYTYVGFAVTAGLIATFVVAAGNPELRPGAVLAFFVLLIARIAIGVPRSIAWRRYAAELKAANGGRCRSRIRCGRAGFSRSCFPSSGGSV
jgi:hypothetical protein